MSEPEIIRLKKEVRRLKELNSQLQQENDELNDRIGRLQLANMANKNKRDLITQADLVQKNKEILRSNIEAAVLEEKTKMEKIQKENEELLKNLKLYQQKLEDNELYIQKIQKENNDIKRQLIDFGKKHEGKDIIDNQRNRDDLIQKKEEEYYNFIPQWNNLRTKMEEVLAENRILRQMADVPENFGIDIAKIQMGDRVKIEDYKAKIRILQNDIADLEEERAKLKHKLKILGSTFNAKGDPFDFLTPEQKVEVFQFAYDLKEGRREVEKGVYDLKEQINQLNQKIIQLQIENANLGGGGRYNYSNMNNTSNMKNENVEDIVRTVLRQQREEMEKSGFTNNQNNISNYESQMNNNNEKLRAAKKPIKKINSMNSEGEYIQENNYENYNYLQLPPQLMPKDPNSTEYDKGLSYRFNTNYKIPSDKIHELFNIAMNDQDVDALKKESAALQSQIIELMEIESRRNANDQILNDNLQNIYGKLESLILIQNEIFDRYMEDKNNNKMNLEKEKKNLEDLRVENEVSRRKIKAFEETLQNLENKSGSDLERKMIEKMKENAILENNNLKLLRKYQCLVEEEKKLREFVENNTKNQIEKDRYIHEKIAKYKGWKDLLIKYLRFLNDKLKKSVDKITFDKMLVQNQYLRKRTNEMNKIDMSLTRQMVLSQTLILKYKDLENSYYLCEEGKLDAEIECNYLRKRLQDCDPNYYNEQKAFRKLSHHLQSLGLSFNQIKNAFIIGGPNLEENLNEEQTNSNILGQSLSFLSGLTMENSFISKNDFENALWRLGISNNDINKTDLQYIYNVLNCENDDIVDVRLFLKKLEQYSTEDSKERINDELLLDKFIQCVRKSKGLLEIFEYFDTNNNGCITREEFKFALSKLQFSINEQEIDKLIFLVSGRPEDEFKLDQNDTFNYIEFCDLFEQKAKNHLLRRRKMNNAKNSINIDWKFNQLSIIISGIEKCRITIEEAFNGSDRTYKGFITFEEFQKVLDSCEVNINFNDSKRLYDMFDHSKKNLIPLENLISELKITEKEIEKYNIMTNNVLSETQQKIDYAKKFTLINEEKQYFNIRMNQMQKRLEELERNNADLTKNLEEYANKNTDFVNKYFSTLDELQQYKETYMSLGVKREDLQRIEFENDSLSREVTILRIGLNTFKELYNASNLQIKNITLNQEKNKDELDTYKRAIKELQSETNQNALIGKLYYTILISRWREANTLRKYDDFVSDFSSLKEENFTLETQNKNLSKNLVDVQVALHEKIIENTKMIDELENYENGLIAFNSDRNETHPMDEMKNLIQMLTDDNKDKIESMIKLKKTVLKLENQNDTLKNKIDFCESLANNIRFNNRDEYSKKLIGMCEEISQLKLNNSILKRENNFGKENENHLQNLNNQLTEGIKEHEKQTAEWENKYRKMQELYKTKDDERQKKIINSLEKMKLYDQNQLQLILNEKSPFGSNNVSNINTLDGKKPVLPPEEYEKKIKQLNTIIKLKNDEIEKLSKINNDNVQMLKDNENFYQINSIPNLVGPEGYDMLKDDETKKIAQTAHKTIKTLQDLLAQKNDIINRKDIQINNLYNELQKVKEADLRKINDLEDQLRDGHETTMKKLQNIIDNTNANLVVRQTKNDLALMTLDDLEKLLADKDNTIKALGLELKAVKDENDLNYIKLGEKNRKIAELEQNLKFNEINNQNNYNNDMLNSLRNQLDEKNREIKEEREKIERIKKDFAKQYQDKKLADENAKLDNTLFVPERLVVNKEKSDLYVKIDKLTKMNRKLTNEKKKMKETLTEKEKEIEDLKTKLDNERKTGKQTIESQIKDTKRISQLKKEKEKLEKNNQQLLEDLDKLKSKVFELEEQNKKNASSSNLRARPQTSTNNRRGNNSNNNNFGNSGNSNLGGSGNNFNNSSFPNDNNNIQSNLIGSQNNINDNLPLINNKGFNSSLNNEDLVKRLVNFCLNKNIILSKQFERYDLPKDGKIKVNDFKNAIEQLHPGFIDSELDKLVSMANPDNYNYIKFRDFIKLMTDKNENYKHLEEKDKSDSNKTSTKKYNPFENKDFNINY